MIDRPAETKDAAYWNAALPIQDRVDDLLKRMTVLEKARQLDMVMGSELYGPMQSETVVGEGGQFDEARAIELLGDAGLGTIHDLYPRTAELANRLQRWLRENSRLGIPCLSMEEALHGLGGAGYTIFPQAISLASTWNPAILESVGKAIAAEMRSCNIHLNFGPVLDLARDPRWGRTEETYGEDPYLTSRLAVSYVKGMQGDDLASETSAIAEPKHFAGHGVPQGGANQGPVHIGPREMLETMFRPFEAAIREGGALGIMCAYHELDGIPCAGNRQLLTDTLREEWGFQGIVVSDLGAIRQLETKHFIANDAPDAIRQALHAGIDVQFYDYPHRVFEDAIISSIEDGTLSPETLNTNVGRVLRLKFLLGLFDKPFIDPSLASRTLRKPEHLSLSLQAARESICLLKNESGILPLQKSVRKIAVIGQGAYTAQLGDYAGTGIRKYVSLLDGVRSIVSSRTEVQYAPGDELETALPSDWLRAEPGAAGLDAKYYSNPDFTGDPLVARRDATIDFNWAIALPAQGMPSDLFSVRWSGFITADRTAKGELTIPRQDSMRVWIDGRLILDSFGAGARAEKTYRAPVTFTQGIAYKLRVEFSKSGGGSQVRIGWAEEGYGIEHAAAIARDADVAIVALGENSLLCGEGLDRSTLDLPELQERLLKAVHATGTPVVLVLQNGRPLSINWASANIPAIIEAWYPAEVGGTALAEVIFGDYNPAGRLPVTVPKSVGQLPLTYDRKPSDQGSYVDSNREPLFPFGFGLSYTTFAYTALQVTPERPTVTDTVQVSVTVTNTGTNAGDEVVQLYLRDCVSTVTTPLKALKGFKRVHLAPGESQTATFTLGFAELSLVNRSLDRVIEPGDFVVQLGGSSTSGLESKFTVV